MYIGTPFAYTYDDDERRRRTRRERSPRLLISPSHEEAKKTLLAPLSIYLLKNPCLLESKDRRRKLTQSFYDISSHNSVSLSPSSPLQHTPSCTLFLLLLTLFSKQSVIISPHNSTQCLPKTFHTGRHIQ